MKMFYLYFTFVLFVSSELNAQDTVQLKKYFGNLKKIDVIIDDSSYSFLFDTGGGETFISPEIVERQKKIVYGNSTGFRMHGEIIKYPKSDSLTLKIGATTIFHPSVGVWDLMSILPKELPKLYGILSLKSFHGKIITLDLYNNQLILETVYSYKKKTQNMTLLKSRFANGLDGNELTIFLNIPNRNRSYWFLFDCGNLDNLLLSSNTAFEWGLQTDSTKLTKALGILSFKMGKKEITSESKADSIIYDGALNYGTLSKSIFLINFREKEIWAK